MKKTILFDLDGTLTDSGEGIINCAILALEHFGCPIPTREEMRIFVGPPLHESFVKHGVPADKTDEDKGGFPVGAIIAIVVVVLAAAGAAVYFFVIKKKPAASTTEEKTEE